MSASQSLLAATAAAASASAATVAAAPSLCNNYAATNLHNHILIARYSCAELHNNSNLTSANEYPQ